MSKVAGTLSSPVGGKLVGIKISDGETDNIRKEAELSTGGVNF